MPKKFATANRASPKSVSNRLSFLVNLRNFWISFDGEFRSPIRSQARTSHLPLEKFQIRTCLDILRKLEGGGGATCFSSNREFAFCYLERRQTQSLRRNKR